MVESEGGHMGSRESIERPLDGVRLSSYRKNEEGHDNLVVVVMVWR